MSDDVPNSNPLVVHGKNKHKNIVSEFRERKLELEVMSKHT